MNIAKYRTDLHKLIQRGRILLLVMARESGMQIKTDIDQNELKGISFTQAYQPWYSEALSCVRQLLPDRVNDFIEYYKPTKIRKDITYGNYTISDYLQGIECNSRVWKR